MEAKIVGNRIKEIMTIEKIDENELAHKLNITILKLEKKLNGEEEFNLSEIMKIKEIFNLTLEIFAKLFFEKYFEIEEIIKELHK